MAMDARCFATLLFRANSGGNFSEHERMVQLWANRMLHFTSLPVYVMYAGLVNASSVLQRADPFGRLRLWRVELLDLATNNTIGKYRWSWTKLHAWRLPCQRLALFDYDGFLAQAADSIFDACGESAELCASKEIWSPAGLGRDAGTRRRDYFNSGVLVLRPSNATFARLLEAATLERQRGAKRKIGEQDFLNVAFPEWREINASYNVQGGAWRQEGLATWTRSGRAHFVHERIGRHPPAFERRLTCRPRPTPECTAGRDAFGCCRDL